MSGLEKLNLTDVIIDLVVRSAGQNPLTQKDPFTAITNPEGPEREGGDQSFRSETVRQRQAKAAGVVTLERILFLVDGFIGVLAQDGLRHALGQPEGRNRGRLRERPQSRKDDE